MTSIKEISEIQISEKFTDPRYFSKNPKLEYVYVVSTLLGQVLTQASSNSVLPLLQVLSRYFDTDDAERTWFMSSFSLAQGTLILISGRIGDIYGLRRAILCGYMWSIIWSMLAGVSFYANTATFFIVARAFTGAGLAFVLPNVMGAAGRIYRPGTRRKHMVFSLIGLSAPLGGSSAPIFSGLIGYETPRWDWAFYVFAIVAALALALSWWSLPFITPHSHDRPGIGVDWIGCFLGLSGLVLFNFSWNQAPISGWDSGLIIGLLVASVVILGVFVWYECYIPSNPLIPRQVMQDPIMLMTLLTLLLSWGSFGILFYRFFVFIQELRQYNALQSGLSLWPSIPSGMIAAMVCGWLISRIKAQFLLVFAMIVFVCSDIMLLKMPVHQSYFQDSLGLWILGVWGMDWSFPAGSIILSDELPPKFQGMAGSLLTTMVMYGQSLFVGISSTLEQQVQKRHPGDVLAVHRACSYFALGLSSSSVVVACIVAVMTLRRHNALRFKSPSPRKRADSLVP